MCSLGSSASLLYKNFYINVVGLSDFNALDCTPLKDPTCTHNSQADDKQVGPTCTAMATIHLVIIECG